MIDAERRVRWVLWLVIASGIALRGVWCWTQQAELTDDRDGYIAHAQSVARGEGYLGPYSQRPTAFRPPAYPIAIGLLQRLSIQPASAVALLNGLSSLLLLIVPVWLLRRAFVPDGRRQLFVLVSAGFIAFDPLLIRYSSLPMTEVPCAAILTCAVALFVLSLRKLPEDDRTNRRGMIAAAIAGVVFAIGAMTRPAVLVACVAAAGVIFMQAFVTLLSQRRWANRQRNSHDGSSNVKTLVSSAASSSRRILLSVVLLAFCGVGMAPWIVRNAVQFGRFIPATTHGGYTLALGNNPDFYRDVIHGHDTFPWNGDALDRWQQRMIQQYSDEGVSGFSETATDAWYYKQAKQAIANDPGAFALSCMLRLRRFWAVSAADEHVPYVVRLGTSAWYAIVWVGLALNLVSVIKRPWLIGQDQSTTTTEEATWFLAMLWAIVAAFAAMHLFYWTDTRMRAPVMPILAMLSAHGWSLLRRSSVMPRKA